MLNDISQGENIKMASKRRLKEAGKNLTDKAVIKMKSMIGSGRGIKKRKSLHNSLSCRKTKKVKTRDIFA